MVRTLRDKVLSMLEGDQGILDVAREVSRALTAAKLECAVIGGVAVVLHGHLRTTRDVDVFCVDIAAVAKVLSGEGFEFDAVNRQFIKDEVPVHLVTIEQVGAPPGEFEEIDGVRTVSLPALISMKLRSGTGNVLRAQDLADVIGLIRVRGLSRSMASRIDKTVRGEYRKLVQAVERDRA